MNTIVPIASGKGGVGKSILTASLGSALAAAGKTVILMDLDLGSGNLHTCLGIKNRYAGIGSIVYKKEKHLNSIIVETEIPRLFFIPGDTLLPGTANLQYFTKKKILKEMKSLVADYVLLDLGAGNNYNVVDFYLNSSSGLVITTPETTAILNAYSFLKTALYRLLYRSFPPRSDERKIIRNFASQRIEQSETNFSNLISQIGSHNAESGQTAEAQKKRFINRIILNMGTNAQDLKIGSRLREIARRNLDVEIEYLGFLHKSDIPSESIIQRKPAYYIDAASTYRKEIDKIAGKLIHAPVPTPPELYESNEDLEEIQEEMQNM